MIGRTFVESDASKATAKEKSHATVIDAALVDALKIDFGGQLILPGDAARSTMRIAKKVGRATKHALEVDREGVRSNLIERKFVQRRRTVIA
jgi:hypothetical protein